MADGNGSAIAFPMTIKTTAWISLCVLQIIKRHEKEKGSNLWRCRSQHKN